MFDYKYDLYVSIGEACSCSLALRNSKLQFYSYPLDWVAKTDIIERVKFFENKFEHFIDKQDLAPSFEVRNISCKAYHNNLTDMVFNHDFKNDVPFDEMYEIVKVKYQRRIDRVINQIKASEKVLFVYIQSPDTNKKITDKILIETQQLLESYFPNVKINLLCIMCNKDVPFGKMKKTQISQNIRILEFDYDMQNPEVPYAVKTKELDKVFRHFSITKKHLTKENIKDMRKYKRKMFFRGKLLFNRIK